MNSSSFSGVGQGALRVAPIKGISLTLGDKNVRATCRGTPAQGVTSVSGRCQFTGWIVGHDQCRCGISTEFQPGKGGSATFGYGTRSPGSPKDCCDSGITLTPSVQIGEVNLSANVPCQQVESMELCTQFRKLTVRGGLEWLTREVRGSVFWNLGFRNAAVGVSGRHGFGRTIVPRDLRLYLKGKLIGVTLGAIVSFDEMIKVDIKSQLGGQRGDITTMCGWSTTRKDDGSVAIAMGGKLRHLVSKASVAGKVDTDGKLIVRMSTPRMLRNVVGISGSVSFAKLGFDRNSLTPDLGMDISIRSMIK